MEPNGSRDYAFKRIIFSMVRDGTRLRCQIEGVRQGCFVVMPVYAREVLDSKRGECYGVWLEDKEMGSR